MSIYSFTAQDIQGQEISLEKYKGKVILIANTASKCDFTPQYDDLQKLYSKYQEQDFVILGFPSNQFGEQEPGDNLEINTFCQLNFGVTFPLFEKTEVRGHNKHPLFAYLTEQKGFEGFDFTDSGAKFLHAHIQHRHPEYLVDQDIKWNFTKFLIDRNGEVISRFESFVNPMDMESAIEELL